MFSIAMTLVFAQESTEGGGLIAFLFPLVILGGLFYVLLILPQRRRQRRMDQMRSEIGIGDEVRTIGGIIGTVVREDGDEFTIDIGGQTMLGVKRAVAERLDDDEDDS